MGKMRWREGKNERSDERSGVRGMQVPRECIRRHGGDRERQQHEDVQRGNGAEPSRQQATGDGREGLFDVSCRCGVAQLKDHSGDVRLPSDDLSTVNLLRKRKDGWPGDDERHHCRNGGRNCNSC
jgi:hypothetical protein